MNTSYQPINNGKIPAKPTTGSNAYNVNKVVIVPKSEWVAIGGNVLDVW